VIFIFSKFGFGFGFGFNWANAIFEKAKISSLTSCFGV
jgi:hypothetical protein